MVVVPVLTPREWQIEAESAVSAFWDIAPSGIEAWDTGQCPMVVAGPGSGKTLFALKLAADRVADGGRVAWLAHRRELLDQPLAALRKFWPDVRGGIVQGGRDKTDGRVVFASVDTLRNDSRRERILEHGPISLIVVDEAHRSMSPTHQTAITGLISEHTKVIALTATPDRMDGADLGKHWQIVYDYPIDRSIADGVTVPPYAVHVPIDFDLDDVDVDDDDALGDALLEQGIVPATVAAMQTIHAAESLVPGDWPATKLLDPNGRTALVFTASVKQARMTAEALTEAGIESRYLSGETPEKRRAQLVQALRDGRIRVICNAMVLTEGTDIPRVSMSVVARPMKSWTLFVQSVTRSGRTFPGKADNLIVDLSGSSQIHNMTAAPVLIGGSPCPVSPNGIHDFEAEDAPSTKGRCRHCGKTVACHVLAGAHDYGPDNTCKGCGRKQCEPSPTGAHTYVPVEGAIRACINCGVEVADPHAGLLNGPPDVEPVEAEWLRVPGLVPESYALDTEDVGMVLVVGNREEDQFTMYWLKKGSPKVRRIGPETMPGSQVRAWANDIARRAKRFTGRRPVTDQQRSYAARVGADLRRIRTTGEANRAISRAKARAKLLQHGLAREQF